MVSCSTSQVIIFKRQTHPSKEERKKVNETTNKRKKRKGNACNIIMNDYVTEQVGLELTGWTCIREVLTSNFGWDTVYFD